MLINSIYSSDSDFSDLDEEWLSYDSGINVSDLYPIAEPLYPENAFRIYDEEEKKTFIIVPDEKTESNIEKINLENDEKSLFRYYIYKFPSKERLSIINYINYQSDGGLEMSSIVLNINHISSLSSINRKNLLGIIIPYMKSKISKFEKYKIIESLFFVHCSDRKAFLQDIKFIINKNMSSNDLIAIIKAVSPILPHERQELLENIKPLINESMTGQDIARIIKLARSLSDKERSTTFKAISPLIKKGMNGKDVCHVYRFFEGI